MSPDVVPGEEAGDCERCDATTTMIGHGHSVFGVRCPECALVTVFPAQDVTGGNYVGPEELEAADGEGGDGQ